MAGFFMNLEYLKIVGINIKEYFVDIVLLIITGLFTNLVVFFVILSFPKIAFLSDNYDFFPLPLPLIQIFVWILFFLIIRWALGKRVATFLSGLFNNKYYFNMSVAGKELTESRLTREWILQGNVHVDDVGLLISNSNAGCLIKPRWYIFSRIWKNLTATMEIEFTPQVNMINPINETTQRGFEKILGIVFRAQNFDDYFLLEICYVNGHIVARPHVRLGGNWDAPELNPDFDSYPLNLDRTNKFKLKIVVKNDKVSAYLNGDMRNPIIWLLPDVVEPRLKQHEAQEKKYASKTTTSEVYFKNRAGMFGFRNYPNELATIKSLDIR